MNAFKPCRGQFRQRSRRDRHILGAANNGSETMYDSSSKRFAIGGCLCSLALVCFAAGCNPAATGTVVDVQDNSVTVTEPDTLEQTTYQVSTEAEITRDGDPASLLQIQPGDDIDVTLSPDESGRDVAVEVTATSNSESTAHNPDVTYNTSFEDPEADIADSEAILGESDTPTDADPNENTAPTLDLKGRIAVVFEESIMIEQSPDDQREVVIEDTTELTIDGNKAEFTELKPGFEVNVTAYEAHGAMNAIRIDATSYEYGVNPTVPMEPGSEEPASNEVPPAPPIREPYIEDEADVEDLPREPGDEDVDEADINEDTDTETDAESEEEADVETEEEVEEPAV
jgi:hypothetical protein